MSEMPRYAAANKDAEIRALKQRIAELEKDAARYRFMVAEMASYSVPFNPPQQYGIEFDPLRLAAQIEADEFWTRDPSKEEIDSAIDAVRNVA